MYRESKTHTFKSLELKDFSLLMKDGKKIPRWEWSFFLLPLTGSGEQWHFPSRDLASSRFEAMLLIPRQAWSAGQQCCVSLEAQQSVFNPFSPRLLLKLPSPGSSCWLEGLCPSSLPALLAHV